MSTSADWPSELPADKPTEPGLDITRALFGRKWLIILFTGVGLGLGHLHFSKQPPTFASYSKIMVQKSMAHLPVDYVDAARKDDPIDNHIYLMTQPAILESAIERGGLKELRSLSHVTNPAGVIAKGLRANRSVMTKDVIELSYFGGDRHDCRKILEAVVDAYKLWLSDTQRNNATDALRLISEARDKLDRDLKEYQTKLLDFQERSSLLFVDGRGINTFDRTLEDIESRRRTASFERQQLQTHLETIQSGLERGTSREALLLVANTSDKTEKSEVNPYMNKITELVIEKERMSKQVGASHPSVKNIEAAIDSLRRNFFQENATTGVARRDLLDVYIESLRERIRAFDRELQKLDEQFKATQVDAKRIASEQLEQTHLLSEGEQRKKLFDLVVEKLQAVDLAKNQGVLNANVTQQPTPGVQVGPDFAKYLGLGGAAGFLVAISLSFLLEVADKSFRNPDEITKQLGLPVIGHIPELEVGRDARIVRDGVVDRSLSTHHRPRSRMAEAYRAVRAALFFGTRGQGNRVIQITSADPGDGKSTLAANLAVAIATSGKKCLLVDADLRRPRVHALFGLENTVGVSSVVNDGLDVPDAVQQSSIANLDIMTVGPRVENPAELLLSPRFTELVAVLRERYDFVLFDTPPVLAVTDPAAVAAHVDGVVLVVRITKRSRPHGKRACETLDLIGARVLGVVVNGVDGRTPDYAGGYGSSYGANPYRYGGSRDGGYSDAYFTESGSTR
ncbi:MAG: polysaccharide biosynthesis tyrosine autokinase [Planctomyces sp.]|nr:polysaccharide biosynthesis tyrosine autokinase [Planctomyces sp.]